MTLVLAIPAKDGVALVADGKATAGKGLVTRSAARKLGALHGRVAYGCAGHAGLRQRVVQSLEANITGADCQEPIERLRPRLRQAVNVIQRQAAGEFVAFGPFDECTLKIAALFVGVEPTTGKPWIYEIDTDGGDELHPAGEAIGSGRPYARYALMSSEHSNVAEREIDTAQLLAFRAVDDAIRTDAHDLGAPISQFIVTAGGAREILGEELKAVEHAMIAWQGHEREFFDRSSSKQEQSAKADDSGEGAITGIIPPEST